MNSLNSSLDEMLEHLEKISSEYSKLPVLNFESVGIKTDKEISDYVKTLLVEIEKVPYFARHKRDRFKEAYFMEGDSGTIASYRGFGFISINLRYKNEPETPHAVAHEIAHIHAARFDELLATLLGWEAGAALALKGDSLQEASLLYVLRNSLYVASNILAREENKVEYWREKAARILGKEFVDETEGCITNEGLLLRTLEDYTLAPYTYVLDCIRSKTDKISDKDLADDTVEISNLVRFLKKRLDL
ncbi:MAG: hypothetical protein Q8N77_00790 [Nanoarchaeota archaeon]|nr:hypothetical protein [Nanoarchaeota archaeon]